MKGNSILSSPAILSDPRMRLAARQIYAFFKRTCSKFLQFYRVIEKLNRRVVDKNV